MIRTILLDFGGVLFEVDYQAPIRAFQKLGFAQFQDLFAQAGQNEYIDRLETGKISDGDFLNWLHSFAPETSSQQISEAWNSILIGLWEPQVDIVKQVRKEGFNTFIFSNTNSIHAAVFEKMIDSTYGLARFRELFNGIVYSHQLGLRKPDPQAFIAVCQLHGLVPEEVLFIDDSPQHVAGAQRAGLRAVHLARPEDLEHVLHEYLR